MQKSNIGRKVKITTSGCFLPENAVGQIATILEESGCTFKVRLPNGGIARPFRPDHTTPECIFIEDIVEQPVDSEKPVPAAEESHSEALISLNLCPGDKVRVLRKAGSRSRGWHNSWVYDMDNAIGEICTVTEFPSEKGVCLQIDAISEKQPDAPAYSYPAYVLELVNKTNDVISNNPPEKQEVLLPVAITGENPLLIKAIWEDLKKLGYFTENELERNWRAIVTNKNGNISSKSEFKHMYITCDTHDVEDTLKSEYTASYKVFNLPEDYTKCIEYMRDILSTPEPPSYKVGDWVTVLNNEHTKNGYHNRVIGNTYKVNAIEIGGVRIGKRDGNGWVNFNGVRRATDDEIKNATSSIIEIGTSANKLKVHVDAAGITAIGKKLSPSNLRKLLDSMVAVLSYKDFNTVIPSIAIEIENSKFSGITITDLRRVLTEYTEFKKYGK